VPSTPSKASLALIRLLLLTGQRRAEVVHMPWSELRAFVVTTRNEKLGIAPQCCRGIVNHVSGLAKAGVAGVYNGAMYLAERRAGLWAWSTYLDELQLQH
jgi:hypothetical protein